MEPDKITRAVKFLHALPKLKKFFCLDLRIGAALLASVGIILDIHIFNASIALTMICLTDVHDALAIEIDKFCARVWGLFIGGIISFVSGILYMGITVPALACDALQLFGVIPVRLFLRKLKISLHQQINSRKSLTRSSYCFTHVFQFSC